MLGLGRTGKSTIVNALAGRKITGTEEQTEKFEIWQYYQRHPKRLVGDNDAPKNNSDIPDKPINFYIPDYRGQDLSKLIRGFLIEQTKPQTPLRYGDINTLLLVVDFVPETKKRDGTFNHTNVEKPVRSRVDAHLNQWSKTALDAIFGLLVVEALESIILLVNKCDLLVNGKGLDENKKLIDGCFADLINDLERRRYGPDREASFHIIHAAAEHGTHIVGKNSLQHILIDSSVPQREA